MSVTPGLFTLNYIRSVQHELKLITISLYSMSWKSIRFCVCHWVWKARTVWVEVNWIQNCQWGFAKSVQHELKSIGFYVCHCRFVKSVQYELKVIEILCLSSVGLQKTNSMSWKSLGFYVCHCGFIKSECTVWVHVYVCQCGFVNVYTVWVEVSGILYLSLWVCNVWAVWIEVIANPQLQT